MSRPLAPSTSLTSVSAATTPSSPGLKSGTRPKCTEPRTATGVGHRVLPMAMHRDAREGRGTKILVGVSMALVLADVAAYLFLIRAQGGAAPSDVFTVAFVAGYMLLMAIVLTLSLFHGPRLVAMRPVLRTAAAAGLLVLGVFALFSIGLLIVLAGVLATIGAIRSMAVPRLARRPGLLEIAAAVIAVTVLMGGF